MTMNVPKELRYHPEHTWARLEDGVATVGITDHAQKELGDIVFLELPEEGRELSEGEVFGTVESSKSVSELYCPVGGNVEAVNRGVEDAPERINDDPYGEGWLIRVRLSPGFDPSRLLDAAAYEEHVGES
jgi:glycine cleavage system H protein